MSEEKQIEEMAKDICDFNNQNIAMLVSTFITFVATTLYNAGYHKRSEGEWFLLDECANEGVYCSICHKKVYQKEYANQKVKSPYCPNCGNKMKGGEGR